ncbi:MAG: hypothetical protein R3E62_03480 [Pseudomonadales bacterium]
MQYLFAALTLVLLLGTALLAQQTGMATQSLFVLTGAVALYVAFSLIKKRPPENCDE